MGRNKLTEEDKVKIDKFVKVVVDTINTKGHRAKSMWYYRSMHPYSKLQEAPPITLSTTPEGKYFRKGLAEHNLTLYRGNFMSLDEANIKRERTKKKRAFTRDNKEEIDRQKRLIRNFRKMFADDGIRIMFSGVNNNFELRQRVVRLFDEYELSEALEHYEILSDLKNG